MKDIIKIAEVCVEKNKSHCLDCSKSAEKDMLLTCRSLMKELLMYISKLTIDNEKLKSLNNSISLGADLHSESYKQEITDIEKERDKYKGLYETMYRKYCKLEAETYTKEDVKEFKDRIALLEKDFVNGWRKDLETELRKFAERLKEKAIRRQEFIGELAIDDVEYVKTQDIDETLKEFIN